MIFKHVDGFCERSFVQLMLSKNVSEHLNAAITRGLPPSDLEVSSCRRFYIRYCRHQQCLPSVTVLSRYHLSLQLPAPYSHPSHQESPSNKLDKQQHSNAAVPAAVPAQELGMAGDQVTFKYVYIPADP